MKKRQFFSALLIYLFAITILPFGAIVDKANAAEIPNDYSDYKISESPIWDSAVQEDFAILSQDDGIYTNQNGEMELKSKGKYTFGLFIGKNKENAYFKSFTKFIEFNLTTGNYKMLDIPVDKQGSFVTSGVIDKEGNKWFAVTDRSNFYKPEFYLLRINGSDGAYQKVKLDGLNYNVDNLKCDINNNIWIQGGDSNQLMIKVNFDKTTNQITFKTFELSSSKTLLPKFEVNKDGEIFVASYTDGRVWDILEYREVNGQMVFDKTIDSKTTSFTTDNNGELWFLTKGDSSTSNYKVCKLENTALNKKYDVSNLMNKLKVYNDNNMILTGQNLSNLSLGKITCAYKVISSKNSTSSHKIGWNNSNGKWYYNDANGIIKNAWRKIDNTWYYFKNDGTMSTDWQLIGGKWYYLGDGAMRTGWVFSGSKWYYLNNDGAMTTDWQLVGGKWYYLGDGAMRTGWITSGGKWYYLQNDGAMTTGWQLSGGTWYYLGDGAMRTGWVSSAGKWYYLYSSGAMAANTTIDGYRLGSDGAWIH